MTSSSIVPHNEDDVTFIGPLGLAVYAKRSGQCQLGEVDTAKPFWGNRDRVGW